MKSAKHALVEFSDVRLAYGRTTILHIPEWRIFDCERWFILGPNGSGKSTLLNAILGLLEPASGTIRRSPVLSGGRAIAAVPQRLAWRQNLPLTTGEFIELGLANLKLTGRERHRRVREALEMVSLSELANTPLWELSGGQHQRATLARAWVRRPRLLVLDEPATGLDPAAEESFYRLIDRLVEETRLAVVIATHDLALAVLHADGIGLIDGATLAPGSPQTVMSTEAMKRVFGITWPLGVPG